MLNWFRRILAAPDPVADTVPERVVTMLPILPPPAPVSRVDYLRQLPHDRRYRILRHELLDRISRSRLAGNYILRGSTVLKHWFPDEAREPNDLDLISVYPHDPDRCVGEILHIGNDPSLGDNVFPVTRTNMLPMWEYDMFPGVRFHVPSSENYRTSTVQLDVAFDNDPELPTEEIELVGVEGRPPVRIRAWTREACLASKLCWIANDFADNEGVDEDDLLDAILLAKRGEIQADLLQICVQDILRVQKKDVSVFDGWHAPVIREMRRGGETDRKYPSGDLLGLTWPERDEERRRRQERVVVMEKARDALFYDLVYALAPLLSETVWLPPQDEWGFLQAIARPQSKCVCWAAYTDWLLDRDDPRGEYLRLTVNETGEELTDAQEERVKALNALVPPAWLKYVEPK
ncbi:nucleotidyl transferase AbiEii/AbiGii toxin family protein [Limnoglobus roseus]|uniref:Nucleotidyl transferase AbiEii/AbiGii toxin family protein n=1 Tax=Limnoglobus roseus TaxID=2598579 RepID=A0A5C1ACX1_9BACT|nr:nucleotidyl transferase AbiEii/AbiGii toxin family protein [Limnoglobus roseus]QEL14964.1 hypothetical protein PX52LOC_01867 [Limnoglobus roseus]